MRNLELMRGFYLQWPISQTTSAKSPNDSELGQHKTSRSSGGNDGFVSAMSRKPRVAIGALTTSSFAVRYWAPWLVRASQTSRAGASSPNQ